MPYAGKTIMPREIAAAAREFWWDFELTKAVAVALAESKGSLGAWNDNEGSDGAVKTRDCGLYQINIPARYIGTDVEARLRTDSLDPAVWEPVRDANIERAHELYITPWTRDGKAAIRRWQPWYAYTTGWATFPEWWVWRHVGGVPEGPWVKTGRYIQKAIVGQANYHVAIKKDWDSAKALRFAQNYADHFGVDQGVLIVGSNGLIGWSQIPKKPAVPPADGHGPRPVPNNGV